MMTTNDPPPHDYPPDPAPPDRPPSPADDPRVPEAQPVVAGRMLDYGSHVPPARKVQMFPMPMSRLRAMLEILLLLPGGIAGAVGLYLIALALNPDDPRWLNVANGMGMGAGAVAVSGLALLIAGHKPMTVGLTLRSFGVEVGIGLATLVVTYGVLLCISMLALMLDPSLMTEKPQAQQAIEQVFPTFTLGPLVLMCAFVAFWEEFVIRGFVLTRLQAVFRRWWLTVPAGAVLFGVMHVYEGWLAVGVVTLLGVIMGSLLVWRKSLVSAMVLHFLHNFTIFNVLQALPDLWSEGS